MRSQNNAYERYLSTQVETATPGRLVLMLYDSAIKRLHQTRAAMQGEDYEAAHRFLLKVQDILVELMVSLNHEIGGEISANLYRLYDYMYRTLVSANVKRDTAAVDEVSSMLTDLRMAWETALSGDQAATVAQAAQEPLPLAAGAEAMSAMLSPPGARLNLQG